MGKKPTLTTHKRGVAIHLYRAGRPDYCIAQALGLPTRLITEGREGVGFPMVKSPQSIPRLDDEEHECRLVMYRAGKSDREIAEARGVSRQAVNRWRHQYRLENPRR